MSRSLAASPVFVRVDDVTAASFDFDPDQPRDPHSGEWIDVTPGGMGGVKAVGDLLRGDAALNAVTHDGDLNSAGQRAANHYATSSGIFNRTLRSSRGTEVLGSRGIDVDALDEAMDDHRVEHDIQTYRGFTVPEHVFGSAWKEDGDNTGLSWIDHGYTSTTTDEHPNWSNGVGSGVKSWGDGLVMRITVPKGSRGLRLSPGNAEWSDQHEVLLGRGSKFAITKDHGVVERPDGFRGRLVDVTVIPTETPPPPKLVAKRSSPETFEQFLKREYGDNPTDRQIYYARNRYNDDPLYERDLAALPQQEAARTAARVERAKDRPKKKRKLFGRG
jgi:hypothetical protein